MAEGRTRSGEAEDLQFSTGGKAMDPYVAWWLIEPSTFPEGLLFATRFAGLNVVLCVDVFLYVSVLC